MIHPPAQECNPGGIFVVLSLNALLELDFCAEGMWSGKILPSKSLSKEKLSPALIQILAGERNHPKTEGGCSRSAPRARTCFLLRVPCPFLLRRLVSFSITLLLLPVCKGRDASGSRRGKPRANTARKPAYECMLTPSHAW